MRKGVALEEETEALASSPVPFLRGSDIDPINRTRPRSGFKAPPRFQDDALAVPFPDQAGFLRVVSQDPPLHLDAIERL
jgi:hypothetical protein